MSMHKNDYGGMYVYQGAVLHEIIVSINLFLLLLMHILHTKCEMLLMNSTNISSVGSSRKNLHNIYLFRKGERKKFSKT